MSHPVRIIAAAGAIALISAAQAGAADYNPPIYMEEVPSWVPVEIGSGWYLRGDLSYNFDPLYEDDFLGVPVDNRRIGGSLGVGYHFTDFLRADANIGYLGNDRYRFDDGTVVLDGSSSLWSAMANAYVDLGTISGVTPYVGAGAGIVYASQSFDLEVAGVPLLAIDDRQYEFAYSLNAGVAYQVSDNVSLDLGYQFLNVPGLEYVDPDTLTIEEGTRMHQVKLGVRYNLW